MTGIDRAGDTDDLVLPNINRHRLVVGLVLAVAVATMAAMWATQRSVAAHNPRFNEPGYSAPVKGDEPARIAGVAPEIGLGTHAIVTSPEALEFVWANIGAPSWTQPVNFDQHSVVVMQLPGSAECWADVEATGRVELSWRGQVDPASPSVLTTVATDGLAPLWKVSIDTDAGTECDPDGTGPQSMVAMQLPFRIDHTPAFYEVSVAHRGIGPILVDPVIDHGLSTVNPTTLANFAGATGAALTSERHLVSHLGIGAVSLSTPVDVADVVWDIANPRCGTVDLAALADGVETVAWPIGPNAAYVVAFVIAEDPGFQTVANLGIGSTLADVQAAYGDRVVVSPPSDGPSRVASLDLGGVTMSFVLDERDVVTTLALSQRGLIGDQRCSAGAP